MKYVILTPNPYRDKGFQTVRRAAEVLNKAGYHSLDIREKGEWMAIAARK